MLTRILSFTLWMLLAMNLTGLRAQKLFVEGIITYTVSVSNPPENDQFKKAGTYNLLLKGNMVRKELKLNGYTSTIIINGTNNSIYSLRTSSGNKLAIQLDYNELLERRKEFGNFSLSKISGTVPMSGYNAQKAEIRYKDGSSTVILYTEEVQLSATDLFERFPDIRVLPLSFELKNEDGVTMRFEAQKVEIKPVESSVFRIPEDYKIISNKEFKEMND